MPGPSGSPPPEPQDALGCARAFAAEAAYVRHLLRRHGVDGNDVEDLAQEVFVVMWRRRADFRPERPLRAWLAGIAHKVAQGHRRRRGREILRDLPERADGSLPPEDQLASVRTRGLVAQAIAGLPERHRSLLLLHDFDEVPMQQIAARYSLPLFTAYTRLRSARHALAKALKRAHVAPALLPLCWRVGVDRESDDQGDGSPGAPAGGLGSAVGGGAAIAWLLVRVRGLASVLRPAAAVAVAAALLGVVALVSLARGPAVARGFAPLETSPHRSGAERAFIAAGWPAPPGSEDEAAAVEAARIDLPRGLLGYWPLDDGAGSALAADASGNAGPCSLHGLDERAARPGWHNAWIDGVHGRALHLGGRRWLECPGGPLAGLDRELSIALWIKPVGGAAGIRALVNRQLGEGRKDHFFVGLDDLSVETSSHLWKGGISRPLPLEPERWVHIAMVHDESLTRLYVNGLEIGRKRTRPVSLGGGNHPLLIGAGANGPDPARVDELFEGAVDELLIYGRTLSEAEVQALASGARPGS